MKWGPCLQGDINYDRHVQGAWGWGRGARAWGEGSIFELDFEECVRFQGCGAKGGGVLGQVDSLCGAQTKQKNTLCSGNDK